MFIYFTDAVLRGPTIGTMLMCLAAALVGVLLVLRKQSLMGEALSHAAYPGVLVGVIFSGFIDEEVGGLIPILVGAFLSSLLGLWAIYQLERKLHVASDAALCFVLSSFFGIGITLASDVQFSFSSLYKKAQTYLYGQAATMTDVHIWIFGILSLIVVMTILFLYKELQVMTFNQDYASSLGIPVNAIQTVIFVLTVLAVVIGIRSVGIVLMSAMLIAPAAAARHYSHRLSVIMLLAAIFGMLSAYLGNVLSIELSAPHFSVPTGPMIVIAASSICLISLLIAPERGLLQRLVRIVRFHYQCLGENLLKTIWRAGPTSEISISHIAQYQNVSRLYLRFALMRLIQNGWIEKTNSDNYRLTHEGQQRASHIVRLHRLWEVYLANYLGVGEERVHRNAEEMEHIITPELERELTLLLNDPQTDPHNQAIPPGISR